MEKISVTILTKNSASTLKNVLEALELFDEVLIYDNGSTDETLEIASSFRNARIEKGSFDGFGPTHNKASALAKNDWIFSVDSDEIATKQLVEEINKLKLDIRCVYSVWRKNFYRDTFVKGCGWYPDRVNRLYNKTTTRFSSDLVHEKIQSCSLHEVKLNNPLLHTPYKSIAEFLNKMQNYTSLYATQEGGKKKSSLAIAITHGIFAFIKSYLIKRGILLGSVGLEISIYNGITSYYKYLKLREKRSSNTSMS